MNNRYHPSKKEFQIARIIIGLYWFIHHRMFGYVINYDGKLIWLNLLFLFSIVLMPYTTAAYSAYSTPEYVRLVLPTLCTSLTSASRVS